MDNVTDKTVIFHSGFFKPTNGFSWCSAISAEKNADIDTIAKIVRNIYQKRISSFPWRLYLADRSQRFMASEIIREKRCSFRWRITLFYTVEIITRYQWAWWLWYPRINGWAWRPKKMVIGNKSKRKSRKLVPKPVWIWKTYLKTKFTELWVKAAG